MRVVHGAVGNAVAFTFPAHEHRIWPDPDCDRCPDLNANRDAITDAIRRAKPTATVTIIFPDPHADDDPTVATDY